MTPSRRTPWFLVCGASLGWGIGATVDRLDLRRGPPGWTLEQPSIPVYLAVEGDLPEGGAWPLEDQSHLVSAGERDHLGLVVEVPVGGTVEATLGTAKNRGTGVYLSRGAEPWTRAMQRFGPKRARWLACSGALPPPGDGPVPVSLSVSRNKMLVSVGGDEVSCPIQPVKVREARVRSGVLRALLWEVDGVPSPGARWARRGALAASGALLLGLMGWLSRRWRWSAAAVLPLLLAGPAAGLDADSVMQALRIPAKEPLWWMVGAPLALCLAATAVGLTHQLARQRWWWTAPFAGAVLATLGTAAVRPTGMLALPWAALAGACAAAIVVANVRQPRGFNVMSLALFALGLGATEGALRWTATGDSWAGISSRANASLRSEYDELTRDRRYTDYPDMGYPIEPPPREAPVRVVALGGSSTGGAFVSDDLSTFYPARLDRLLGDDVQVVNQGVGGWTTLHIRRYVEDASGGLDADVAILYIGHNDRMTEAAVPYAEVFRAWDDRPAARFSLMLTGVRLYQGLRFTVGALAGRSGGVAVPLDDARDNVAAIVSRFRQDGTRVLLSREAVSRGSELLMDYSEMLCGFGAADVACFDAAALLEDPLQSDVFVDAVHLTSRGHDLLAAGLAADLHDRGWLTPRSLPAAGSTP